ncbi:MAG TPA: DUF2922 domain-containing protein [Clostridiaceae bacterium]|nr:DUF2922 domain-containing protein [Clostridiaceae bacterium]
MPVKTLVLIFQNQQGKNTRISVDNAKEGLTDAEVKSAMQSIVEKNIFETDGGDLVALAGAQIVTRSVQDISVK